jgi:hypothetical protein
MRRRVVEAMVMVTPKNGGHQNDEESRIEEAKRMDEMDWMDG